MDFSTPVADISIDSDEIITIRLKEDAEIDIENVDLIDQQIKALSKGRPCYLLVLPSPGSHSPHDARQHASNLREGKKIVAEAIVVQNLAVRMLANFYSKINNPKQIIKVFGNIPDARAWLMQEMKRHGHYTKGDS